MRAPVAATIVAASLLFAAARLDAQDRAAKPAAPAAPAAPATGPVIAPSKPVVAPGMGARGDAGALPAAARSANATTISVSARQAAEQTIAALVAAMKNIPKRPPAPPEPRTARARRGEAGAQGQDAPPPITYHVTWPATPPELGVGRRVELDWAGEPSGPVRLHWND